MKTIRAINKQTKKEETVFGPADEKQCLQILDIVKKLPPAMINYDQFKIV